MSAQAESIRKIIAGSGFDRLLASLSVEDLADFKDDLVKSAEAFASAEYEEDAGDSGAWEREYGAAKRHAAHELVGAGNYRPTLYGAERLAAIETIRRLVSKLASIEISRAYGDEGTPGAKEVLGDALDQLGIATFTITAKMRADALEALKSIRSEISQDDAEETVDLAIAYATSEEGFMDRCLDAEFLAEIYDQNVGARFPSAPSATELENGERSDDER